ncbi:MAG: SDR family oxidoreductase [Elusimicrobiota bacterium]
MEIDKRKKVLVTGANGFIGRNLCATLKEKGYIVRGAVRNNAHDVTGADDYIQVGDINESTDWTNALKNIDFVIHLAGRAHVMDEQESDPASVYHRVNVLGTECLAIACARAGVHKFIYISSIGVNGEFTDRKPFTENNIPNPVGAYAVSKWEAEQTLRKAAKNTGMEVVILRPPLVYGPNAPGNFSRLMHLIKKRIPLPLGKIKNLHSFLYLGNLVDAIITCVTHPLAAGETFLVSDGQDISTPDLIKMLAFAMNKKAVLFSLHSCILKALCRIAGKAEELEKLTGTLLVDSSKIRNMLGWEPPFTIEEGIKATVRGMTLT